MNTLNMPRINPRRPMHLSAAGVPRIVLGETATLDGAIFVAQNNHESSIKLQRSHEAFTDAILVASVSERGHLTDHAREVVAAAALLASPTTEVVLAVLGECLDDVAEFGVDALIQNAQYNADHWQPAAMSAWLAECVTQTHARQIYMADNSVDGDWARRYAAQSGVSYAAHVVELQASHARIRADAQHDVLLAQPTLLLLDKNVTAVELPFVGRGAMRDAPVFASPSCNGIVDNGIAAGNAQTVALEEADFIISAGKGMQDLTLFNELAHELGAATGASRVAVDDGMFARTRQVGATGKTVQASTYIALGISGAVQHLQGIKDCRHVIAVNLDAAAPIARRANVMVVEDTGEWMRALLAEIRIAKQGKTK